MIIRPIKTRIFREGEDIFVFVTSYLKKIPERTIIVVTSKIVALSENRTVLVKDARAKAKLIRRESDLAMPAKYVWLTVKDGMVMASAGIDESNARGKLIFLPKDSYRSANLLRHKLQKKYRVKELGVLITDSCIMPLRAGVLGAALGYAGFAGVRDHRGTSDIFGRKLRFSRTNIADGLATVATLMMGEGNEQTPLAIIQDAPVEFRERISRKELRIKMREDMYYPLFKKLPGIRK